MQTGLKPGSSIYSKLLLHCSPKCRLWGCLIRPGSPVKGYLIRLSLMPLRSRVGQNCKPVKLLTLNSALLLAVRSKAQRSVMNIAAKHSSGHKSSMRVQLNSTFNSQLIRTAAAVTVLLEVKAAEAVSRVKSQEEAAPCRNAVGQCRAVIRLQVCLGNHVGHKLVMSSTDHQGNRSQCSSSGRQA